MHRRIALSLVVLALGCGDDTEVPVQPGNPQLLPGELGRVRSDQSPPFPPGVGVKIAYAGVLSPTGVGIAHLPPEAGNAAFEPMMRCYVRRNATSAYREILPVEDSPVPCGFSWHESHLDAVTESTETPSWLAAVSVLVP